MSPTAKPALTQYDVANAARVAVALFGAGVTPPPLTDAAKAAGLGPHDKWPHAVMRPVITALTEFADNPKTGRAAWVAEQTPLAAQIDGASNDDLARWLVAVGDPAWAEVDAIKSGTVSERIRAARATIAGRVVAAVFDETCAAAQRGADHQAETVDAYARDDAELDRRFEADKVAEDIRAETRRQIKKRRDALRVKAMWGVLR